MKVFSLKSHNEELFKNKIKIIKCFMSLLKTKKINKGIPIGEVK